MEHTCPNLVQVAAPGLGMGWVVTQLLDSDLRRRGGHSTLRFVEQVVAQLCNLTKEIIQSPVT